MEILKAANDWAKAEIFSSIIFILFGVLFLLTTIIFWQFGKTELSKAFIYPTLIAGSILLMAGIGFYFGNKSRLSSFEADYKANPSEFIKSEIIRTERTTGEYKNVAFKVFPAIIIIAALLFIFIDRPIWRAISITIIAFFVVLILLDINANARIETYNKQLELVAKDLKN